VRLRAFPYVQLFHVHKPKSDEPDTLREFLRNRWLMFKFSEECCHIATDDG
jgi:hypothetical protein